ncbi:cytochrome P450 [Pseudonocardia nematodicida]|uniref:Cytochrome P450 n=1 Tax=Pseudonocardia nematodicida TaxID=1206997 RepID=A0ABV1KJY0_9PSEU
MTADTTDADLPRLPFPRDDVVDPPALFAELRARAPVTPVRTPAGDVAWLVTGYPEARELFADPRLGRSHPDPDRAPRISGSVIFGGPSGGSPETEREQHMLMRRLLAPAFSARRMQRLTGHVAELVAECLDAMERAGPGVDLHETLSFPLPVLVICELLGVPFADRDRFREWSEGLSRLDDRGHAEDSAVKLHRYVRELIDRKATRPGEDVLSDFAALATDDAARDRLAGLGSGLLFAGHETTVGRIDAGTLLLLDRPDEWAALAASPQPAVPAAEAVADDVPAGSPAADRVAAVVEEILRMAAPGGAAGGVPRYAHADLDVAGVRVRTGDAVLLAPGAANRDPREFADPDRFDAARRPAHLAFGHGPYFCVGASLARVELTEVFRALPARFPTLRLAVPRAELRPRADVLTGGLRSLPVEWDR